MSDGHDVVYILVYMNMFTYHYILPFSLVFHSFFMTVNSKVSMITNWAFPSFKADLALPSASGDCTIHLELHLPIPYHPKEIAFPICVIFRPCADRLAVLYGGSPQTLSSDRLREAKAPLGEQISKEMFPV